MSDRTVKNIQFDKYYKLLERLLPAASGLALFDGKGLLVAEYGDSFAESSSDYTPAEPCGDAEDGRFHTHVCKAAGEHLILRQDISSSTGSKLGTWLIRMGSKFSRKDCDALHAAAGSIDAVASCFARECELTDELDSMAQELTARYEELNLVFTSNNDTVSQANEVETINNLLHSYVEHLDVGIVALILHAQDKIHYAVSDINPIKEPHQLLQQFATALLSRTGDSQACLILNGAADMQRKDLALDIPYKVIVCPVLDSQGAAIASLVCMNHLSKPDYFNSDKNLLEVMSRKITKIIQANHDVLTGLVNQRAFTYILKEKIESASRNGVSHVYLNIDLDQLSIVNDAYGRDAGDTVIRSVSAQLKNNLRTADIISYLGEGRFGVVLEICDIEKGRRVAEKLAKAVSKTPHKFDRESVELSVCVGITSVGPDAISTDAILEAGELARNAAKKAGRNQIRVYQGDSAEMLELKEQMQTVNRIQRAMRNNQFMIYCQEIMPTSAVHEKYHFEILVRMAGDNGAVIPPSQFIPTAERYNLMPALDRWIIDNVFAQLRANGLAQLPLEGLVSINLSGQSLADERLADYISEMLYKYQLQPDCICFEITETSAFGNMQSARLIIDRLKAIGCQFSLDDFGTGLSSFSYLKELPVDYLKIDGSFVRVMLEDRIAHAMVSSINQIGHLMHLKTIAEYVESEEIASQLRQLDIDYLQGYAIGKTVPLEDYLAKHGLAAVSRVG